MYVVIVGCGTVGYQLTKALLASGHEVLAIEKDVRRCEDVTEDLGSVTMVGDGSEVGVLAEAGVARADVLIAVTGQDEDNLVTCQLGKDLFQVPRTIALINNPQNEPLFKTLGVDVTVSSTDIILAHIEEKLPAHPIVHLMPLKESNREIVEVTIPSDAAVVGRPLKDIILPPDSVISLIIRKDGHTEIPEEDTVLMAEDGVVAITTPGGEDALWDTLTRAG